MEKVENKQEYGQTADGTRLFYQSWRPEEPNNKVLIIVHGLGEHSGRYTHLANYFANAGYTLYALDHRGHGLSGGRRGHIENFGEYRADLRWFFQKVQTDTPGKKYYFVGHSLGGLMTLNFTLKHPEGIDGVVVSSSGLQFKMKVPKIKQSLARLLSRYWPTLTMANGIDPKLLTHDPAIVSSYAPDPLTHNRASARFFTEFVDTMEQTLREAPNFKPPLLIMHGGADEIVAPEGSRKFFERVRHDEKKLIIYDGFYHEIFNETDHLRVFEDVKAWLAKH